MAAQSLEVIYGLVNNMTVVMEGAPRLPVRMATCMVLNGFPDRWKGIDGGYSRNSRCVLLTIENRCFFNRSLKSLYNKRRSKSTRPNVRALVTLPSLTSILRLLSQATSYKRSFDVGCLHQIRQQTKILLAKPIIMEPPCGSPKATPSKNGKRWVRFFGFMEIVCISHIFVPCYS
jgi:hypothetical protein